MWFDYLDCSYNLDACILYKNHKEDIHLLFNNDVVLLINKKDNEVLVKSIQRAIKLRKI